MKMIILQPGKLWKLAGCLAKEHIITHFAHVPFITILQAAHASDWCYSLTSHPTFYVCIFISFIMNHLIAVFIEACIIYFFKKYQQFIMIYCTKIVQDHPLWWCYQWRMCLTQYWFKKNRETLSQRSLFYLVFLRIFLYESKSISMKETNLKVAEIIKFDSFIKF